MYFNQSNLNIMIHSQTSLRVPIFNFQLSIIKCIKIKFHMHVLIMYFLFDFLFLYLNLEFCIIFVAFPFKPFVLNI